MNTRPGQNATFPGQFFDGKSAMAQKVVVRLSTNVIVMSHADGEIGSWTYKDLLAPEPVAPNKPTRLTHATAPYARLVVDAPEFAIGIVERAPQLSRRADRKRTFKVVAACFAAALIVVGALYAFLTIAPRQAAFMMPDEWRTNLGNQVLTAVAGSSPHCTAEKGAAAINQLRQRLSHADAGIQSVPQIFVYDLPVKNAFALPGGHIVVSGKLVREATGPDALAGVLAHEMGHVARRDSETQLIRYLGISIVETLLFGGGSYLSETIGGTAGYLTLLRYSRDAERRADDHAIALLRDAGIDPAGLISFFRQIQEDKGGSEESSATEETFASILSTHPGLDERIEVLEALEPWETTPTLTAQQWQALITICSQAAQ